MTPSLAFLEPIWLWGGLFALTVLLVVWNLPRNLIAGAIAIVALLPGAWGLREAVLLVFWPRTTHVVALALGVTFAVAALFLFTAWATSAWALARRVPLARPAFTVAITVIGLALLGTRLALEVFVGVFFFLGE